MSSSSTITPSNAQYRLPKIVNEPNLFYAPASKERAALQAELAAMEAAAPFAVPAFVGGKAVRALAPSPPTPTDGCALDQVPSTGPLNSQPMPHKHASSLCTFPTSSPELVTEAIAAALGAKSEWENMPFNDRAAIFLKVRLPLLCGGGRALWHTMGTTGAVSEGFRQLGGSQDDS